LLAEVMIEPSERVNVLEGMDLRVCFLLSRTGNRMIRYFVELYRQIEEECEPASRVLEKLGLNRKADALVFYRFRKRCIRWGVWMSERDFAASSKRRYFDPAIISHWSHLSPYLEKGMVPALTESSLPVIVFGKRAERGDVAPNRAVNRKKLRKLPLDVWVGLGFSATEIWRFLHPFFQGLTWLQVYLHLREVRKKVQRNGAPFRSLSGRAEVPEGSDDLAPGSGFKAEETYGSPKDVGVHRGSDRPGEILIFPGSVPGSATVGGGAIGSISARARNGLLELFGDLPDGGRVDDFLFSAGAAKLRNGSFWRSVAEEAGADLRGNTEFGGLNIGVGPGGLGDLLSWCESFSLALTRALGYENSAYFGAMCLYPKYGSFHPWFSVMGHLLRTVRGINPAVRHPELDSYFAKSRLLIQFPNNGGRAELGSLEEAFSLYLVHGSLANAAAEFLIPVLAGEWKKRASKIYLSGGENSLWRTSNHNHLFTDYARAVFSTEGAELEREVKRQLFKPGIFE
jgi:hypothetical protein